MATRQNPATRHIVSINDLSDDEIEHVFDLAQGFLTDLPDATFPYRIGHSTNVANKHILASLFFEPSTRTRLSFESAMHRLGGGVITSADPATSSAAKGESLADTVRVISNYADVMVIRHPRDGAARLAAEYSSIPVINGGDGSHEHPTQTLCDLFTLKRTHKTLRNLNVAMSGDLRGSRTIHSFVYALARFGANIMMMPAKGMGLPAHVDSRLREEFQCRPAPKGSYENDDSSIDALYVTPDEPHQLSLMSDIDSAEAVKIKRKVDAVYVTRFQKERWTETGQAYPKIDAKFLRESKYSTASVMHPLPRVGELDISLDNDDRALYFQQAAYGVPIRMALIAALLGLAKDGSFARYDGGFAQRKFATYEQPMGSGLHCANPNCIVQEPMEAQYARNKFYIVRVDEPERVKLRCVYCESDIEHFVVGSKKTRQFVADPTALTRTDDLKDVIVFADEVEGRARGYHLKRDTPPASRQA